LIVPLFIGRTPAPRYFADSPLNPEEFIRYFPRPSGRSTFLPGKVPGAVPFY